MSVGELETHEWISAGLFLSEVDRRMQVQAFQLLSSDSDRTKGLVHHTARISLKRKSR